MLGNSGNTHSLVSAIVAQNKLIKSNVTHSMINRLSLFHETMSKNNVSVENWVRFMQRLLAQYLHVFLITLWPVPRGHCNDVIQTKTINSLSLTHTYGLLEAVHPFSLVPRCSWLSMCQSHKPTHPSCYYLIIMISHKCLTVMTSHHQIHGLFWLHYAWPVNGQDPSLWEAKDKMQTLSFWSNC